MKELSPLSQFYLGTHPDHQGRLLDDILQQNDRWLEQTHDYIRWLFPNWDASRVNPYASVLTDEAVAAFRESTQMQEELRASFFRLLRFYGLRYSAERIEKAENWDQRKVDWFLVDTHNNLRIGTGLRNRRIGPTVLADGP